MPAARWSGILAAPTWALARTRSRALRAWVSRKPSERRPPSRRITSRRTAGGMSCRARRVHAPTWAAGVRSPAPTWAADVRSPAPTWAADVRSPAPTWEARAHPSISLDWRLDLRSGTYQPSFGVASASVKERRDSVRAMAVYASQTRVLSIEIPLRISIQ
jgi:hypothetical protein